MTSLTERSASCMASVDSVSSGTTLHSVGKRLYSLMLALDSRVSIGSSSIDGGFSGSNISSVGHIVVRPAVEGRMRLP
jgi:hypothetical protein